MSAEIPTQKPVDVASVLRELVESRRQLRAVLDNMPAMIAYWDRDLLNVLGNEAYVDWFGWSPERMLGRHIREVIGEDLYALNRPFMDAALRGELQQFDRAIVDVHGATRYSQAAYVPDVGADGEVLGFFVLVSDVTARVTAEMELAAARDKLEELALTDVLTGLANRRSLQRTLEHFLALLARAAPGDRLLAVLLIDLDGFKPVNDAHGHTAGDEVLVELAQRLKHEVRLPDVLARLGGDEFVVLALDLRDSSSAVELAERLVRRVAEPIRLSNGHQVQVTASIGVALAGQDRSLPSAADLLHVADRRMYAAKTAGGNRTCSALPATAVSSPGASPRDL